MLADHTNRVVFIKKKDKAEIQEGTTSEEVLEMLISRLKYQNGQLPCESYKEAIFHLERVKIVLEERARKRREQGVEGTSLPHREHLGL